VYKNLGEIDLKIMQSQYLYKNLGEIDLKIMQSQYLYKNISENIKCFSLFYCLY